MNNQKEIREGTRQLIEKCRSETKPYIHRVFEMDLVVLPEVWSPKYFRGSEFYAREVSERAKFPFLDIGTGTGIVACAVGRYLGITPEEPGDILATDINPEAVKNAKINAVLHGLDGSMKVRRSDIYDSIKEAFRTIFWNIPFFSEWEGENDLLARATYTPKNEALKKFVRGAGKHLYPYGNLLIGFQTSPEKREVLEKIVINAGFIEPELIAEMGYELPGDVRVEFGLYKTERR